MKRDKLLQAPVRDERDRSLLQRGEAVIHVPDMEAVQVRDVAGDVERQDLPLALVEQLVAAGPALDREAALRGTVAIANDVPPGVEGLKPHRQASDGPTLLGREDGDALQLADEPGR